MVQSRVPENHPAPVAVNGRPRGLVRALGGAVSIAAGAAVVLAADAARRRQVFGIAGDDQRLAHPSAPRHVDPAAAPDNAATPGQLSASGWRAAAGRVWDKFGRDRILLVAAGVTFYALLALFPAIAALVSIFGLVADPAILGQQLDGLKTVLPDGAIEIVGGQITRIASHGGGALTIGFLIGLAVSLWSANAGMKSLFDVLNIVYEEDEKRSFIKLNVESLGLTLGAIVVVIAAMGAIVVVPALFAVLPLGSDTAARVLAWSRWPVLLVGVIVALAVLYRYGPSRDRAAWAWVTWGSATAAVLWLGGSLAFSWYVTNFGAYNETYGSLGAAIGFLTWMWLSVIVVLLGAELNAELEHQTTADTTEGPPRPAGARGATKADTTA